MSLRKSLHFLNQPEDSFVDSTRADGRHKKSRKTFSSVGFVGVSCSLPERTDHLLVARQKKKPISNLHLTTKGNCCRCASIKKHLNLAEKFNRRFRKAKFSSFICAFNPSRRFTETFGPVCKLRAVLDGFYDSFQALAYFTTQTNLN